MLQEHRLPRARGRGTGTGTAAVPATPAAPATRDPLQAQDVPVRRRHLRRYMHIHLYIKSCMDTIQYMHAKSFLSLPSFPCTTPDREHDACERMFVRIVRVRHARFATADVRARCTMHGRRS